jgi:autotransporter-associated beta strand protein
LLINPGAEAEITASHPFGYWGRPVEINEGTLTMSAGAYINGLTMTGGTLAGGLNNWLGLTAHASPNTATVTGKINLLNGNEEFNVADGAQDVDLWMQGGVGDVSWWSGTAGLRKTGDGTMLLEGNSSLGSSTTVEAGTLLVDGTLASTGATVAGGWLGGDGTIDSDLEVQAPGNISAGASPGHLSVTGDYLQAGTMLVEIAGTAQGDPAGYDWIDVAGEATFEVGALVDVDLLGGFQPAYGDQFLVFTAAGGITNADISEISFDLTDAQSMFRLNPALIPWGTGGGEAIVLTAVPEPSALALIACGLLGLVMIRRRR